MNHYLPCLNLFRNHCPDTTDGMESNSFVDDGLLAVGCCHDRIFDLPTRLQVKFSQQLNLVFAELDGRLNKRLALKRIGDCVDSAEGAETMLNQTGCRICIYRLVRFA